MNVLDDRTRLAARQVLVNLAKILLLVLPVAFLSYGLGRYGSIQYRLEHREPGSSGHAISAESASEFERGMPIYVPAYSHIYVEDGRGTLLTVTLSARNTSQEHGIVLERVDYFDTTGSLVRSYLEEPIRLAPLETAEFLVKASDTSGGSGANFIVDWRARAGSPRPMVEAVMVGLTGSGLFSFARDGVFLASETNEAPSPMDMK